MLEDHCLAKGPGNFYLYVTVSTRKVRVAHGDILEYDIFLARTDPAPKGGVDVAFDRGPALRDIPFAGRHVTDQNGLRAHGDALLEPAVGRWYHRRIPLDAAVGRTSRHWDLVFEGDGFGEHVQFVDNVVVSHTGGARTPIYTDGPPTMLRVDGNSGYGKAPVLLPVPRQRVASGADIQALVRNVLAAEARRRRERELVFAVSLGCRLVEADHSLSTAQKARYLKSVQFASDCLARSAGHTGGRSEAGRGVTDVDRAAAAQEELQPVFRLYTGHLVGHAHIDFQWLWNWSDVVDNVIPHTFGQAVKFMDEFSGFTFSQSSSALYAATEAAHPELFRKIREKVAAGQWDIVGGRICEGDTNIISPESHARQFLYGQRYFRERFGKQAVVGWEPDTFGHTWQMPQLLRLAGCKYYYFCRAGFNEPLFLWEAPDGSRVLAFEESATGSWYNSDITEKCFTELADFAENYGSRDMLWVYGVGNHGGGPTRENIETALEWQENPGLPAVKFSTAGRAFAAIAAGIDPKELPTIRTELNTDRDCNFRGCFTSHSDIKRWNRDAEAVTEAAEAIATVAALQGLSYPKKEFRRNWEDICWNHHHDTLGGTAIHSSYAESRKRYMRVIASSRGIGRRALDFLAARVPADTTGKERVLVFNPCGFVRNDMAAVPLTAPEAALARGGGLVAVAPDGTKATVDVLDAPPGPQEKGAADAVGVFATRALPSFGYRVYSLQNRAAPSAGADPVRITVPGADHGADTDIVLESPRFRIEIDSGTGAVSRVRDKKHQRNLLRPGGSARLEIHEEAPNGMSAWTIGRIATVHPLPGPVRIEGVDQGRDRAAVHLLWNYRKSTIRETISLAAGKPTVDFRLDIDWHERGTSKHPNPFLKAAFDLAPVHPVATYDIPFAAIERPTDGKEVPALKWADFSEYAMTPVARTGGGPVPIDLSAYTNADAFADAAAPTDADFDSDHRGFPTAALPGETLSLQGALFRLPRVTRGEPNSVMPKGQVLNVPAGRYSVLGIVGAAGNGDASGKLVLHYAGGTREVVPVALTDWCHPPGPGEVPAVQAKYRLGPGGKEPMACSLFMVSVPVDGARQLLRVTLPRAPRMRIVAMTLGDFGPRRYRRGVPRWGVAVLNDCKHGYSATDTTLRLSLLRCTYHPDPDPETGRHTIRFALFPHTGDWRNGVAARATAYNHPLWTTRVPRTAAGGLPAEFGVLRLSPPNLIATGLKQAEDDRDVVLRFYESTGQGGGAVVAPRFPVASARKVNILEDPLGPIPVQNGTLRTSVRRFEIVTLKLHPTGLRSR